MVIYEIKLRRPRNRVHFYVTCEKRIESDRPSYTLWLRKPKLNAEREWCAETFGSFIASDVNLKWFNLCLVDFWDMKDGEVREVFLNLED